MSIYSHILRPLLFRLDPEVAHSLTVEACRLAGRIPPVRYAFRSCLEVSDDSLRTEIGGLPIKNGPGDVRVIVAEYRNPVGHGEPVLMDLLIQTTLRTPWTDGRSFALRTSTLANGLSRAAPVFDRCLASDVT